jgi:hypothetical protein
VHARTFIPAQSVGRLFFHEDFDLHGTDFLEYESKIKAVIGAERLLQTAQYDMCASRPKIEFTMTGDYHFIHAVADGVHKYRASRPTRGGSQQSLGDCSRILDFYVEIGLRLLRLQDPWVNDNNLLEFHLVRDSTRGKRNRGDGSEHT